MLVFIGMQTFWHSLTFWTVSKWYLMVFVLAYSRSVKRPSLDKITSCATIGITLKATVTIQQSALFCQLIIRHTVIAWTHNASVKWHKLNLKPLCSQKFIWTLTQFNFILFPSTSTSLSLRSVFSFLFLACIFLFCYELCNLLHYLVLMYVHKCVHAKFAQIFTAFHFSKSTWRAPLTWTTAKRKLE